MRIFLFLSSISLLFVAVSLGCGLQFIFEGCSGKHSLYWVFLGVGILGCLFPFLFIYAFKNSNFAEGKCVEIQDQSHDAVTHAVLYISLFVAHDCTLGRYLWLTLFVVLITIIYCQTNKFMLNPVLLMFGYRFYDTQIEFDDSVQPQRFLVLSKTEIRQGQALSINRWSNKPLAILKEGQ